MTEENAANTVSHSMVKEESGGSSPSASLGPFAPRSKGGNRYDEWRCLRKTESPAWDKAIADLAAEIKLRHYSRNTLKAYADWSRKFQNYLKNKPPETLSPAEVHPVRENFVALSINACSPFSGNGIRREFVTLL